MMRAGWPTERARPACAWSSTSNLACSMCGRPLLRSCPRDAKRSNARVGSFGRPSHRSPSLRSSGSLRSMRVLWVALSLLSPGVAFAKGALEIDALDDEKYAEQVVAMADLSGGVYAKIRFGISNVGP